MPKKRRHTNPSPPKLSETNWRAQDDARMLRHAHEVKADPKRHAEAKAHARHEADMMRKVAGRKP